MSLQNILQAITAEADEQIASARTAHERRMSQLKKGSDELLAKEQREIDAGTKEQKSNLLRSADVQMQTHRRNALLQKKRALLDRLYAELTDRLCTLSDAELEPLLRACLRSLPKEKKGLLHPAGTAGTLLRKLDPSLEIGPPIEAKGGFLFTSPLQEQNCTFEHLVEEALRPQTELTVASRLFPSSRAA